MRHGNVPTEQPQRVVLIGATVRAAAQSAQRAGLRVTGLDLFGDRDAQQACQQHFRIGGSEDPVAILQACQDLPLLHVGGLATADPLLGRLAKVCPLHGQPHLWGRLRDADCLRSLAERAGIGFPRTISVSALGATGPLPRDDRWLLKRPESCGGLGVGWAGDHDFALRSDILQAWIAGRVMGATFLSNGRTVRLLGVCRSLYTRNHGRPFVFAGCFGPVPVSPEIGRSLQRLGEQVLENTALRGLFNADFVVDPAGAVWLLEINPRWTASSELIERQLIEQGKTQSLFKLLLEALDGQPGSPSLETRDGQGPMPVTESVYLKRVLYARRQCRFEQARLMRLLGAGESLHDLPLDGRVIRRGDPVCTLIAAIDCSSDDPTGRYRRLSRDLHAAIVGH